MPEIKWKIEKDHTPGLMLPYRATIIEEGSWNIDSDTFGFLWLAELWVRRRIRYMEKSHTEIVDKGTHKW